MPSGKGKSLENPNGVRRVEQSSGLELAPHSLRQSKRYMKLCTDQELKRAQVKRNNYK